MLEWMLLRCLLAPPLHGHNMPVELKDGVVLCAEWA